MTKSIQRIPSDNPAVYAFRISGEAESQDMEAMASTMNIAFERDEKVNMLIIFAPYDGAEPGGAFDGEVIKSQFKAFGSVDKYAVVGAPDYAKTMINAFGSLSPVEAETFDSAEEVEAWTFVGATPMN